MYIYHGFYVNIGFIIDEFAKLIVVEFLMFRVVVSVLKDGSRHTQHFCHITLWRYLITFGTVFYVHVRQFGLICWTLKKFLLARAFSKIFPQKTKRDVKYMIIMVRASCRHFQCFAHIYSKSRQTGLKFRIQVFFLYPLSFTIIKKMGQHFLRDRLFSKCSIQPWAISW